MRRIGWVVLLCGCFGCGDGASDGSSGMGTAETGAEEGGGADAGADPGPHGPGCDEPWEGWWAGAQDDDDGVAQAMQLLPEASAQWGRWHAAAAIDAPGASGSTPSEDEQLRATLISEAAVLSTGRSLAVSWCLGNILPNPQKPFGVIDEERDALNLERYSLFRKELERATRIWERHSRMNFVHLVPLDDRRKPSGGMCDTALEEVWFRAQTPGCGGSLGGRTNAGGENEFDPAVGSPQNPDGYDRLLCIKHELLDAGKKQIPYYAGHETGHIVGLEHEYMRWDQGDNPPTNCRENHPFESVAPERQLTPEDPWSVMGHEECAGSEKSAGISPHDMMGAYYAFNSTDRRVRDMAPQGGGQDRRLWAGNLRPGLLWYAPFPDRLIEWRFAAQQPGPLAYDVIERCMDGAPPCAVHDSNGHWRPIMGQFTGWSDALDVFMYSPDQAADVLLRNRANEGGDGALGFETIDAPAPDRAIPVVGNFVSEGGGQDQLLWYRPGLASDHLWAFDASGGHEVLDVDVDQRDYRIPIVGHFRSRTDTADIIWFEPRTATVDTWRFEDGLSVEKSGSKSVAHMGVAPGAEHLPLVGNFDGDNRTDIFWYTPGSAPDWLWLSEGTQVSITFISYLFAVDGEYHPIVGDFDGDADDDILWYRPAAELAGGLSWMWYFDGPAVEVRALEIAGDYVPYAEDLDGDGCTDILWYDAVAPDNPSPVWRCAPEERTFSCEDPLPTPKAAYPVGLNAGGY